MLHHISLGVVDLKRSASFYDAVLAVLGYVQVWADDTAVGFGLPGGDDELAIKLRAGTYSPGPGFHLAFAAPSREAVTAFHHAALRYGGQEKGAPGLRPHYGPNYFAAFVVDPDGYHIEAVINAPVSTPVCKGLP
jgi:catechol 2,3-dioxygenase-like lactoylglutathione lyase family enzyme